MDNYNLPPKSLILVIDDTNLHGFDIGSYQTISSVSRVSPTLARYSLRNKFGANIYLKEKDVKLSVLP